MTDQTIPADAIRAWRDKYRGCTGNNALEALDALIPAPPRPTLADMTLDERAACRRMQADVKGYENRAVIIQPYLKDGSARVMWATLRVEAVSWANITPRPDLPRMEWPGDQQPAPSLTCLDPKAEDVAPVKVGDVIESADDPRLDTLPVESILSDVDGDDVKKTAGGYWKGDGYIPRPIEGDKFGPWTVCHIGNEADQ